MLSPLLTPFLHEVLSECSARDPEYALGRDRAKRIASVLMNDEESGVYDWRLSGSAGKGTALAPLSDVDMVVYMDGAEWRDDCGRWLPPDELLDWLEARIEYALTWHIQGRYLEVVRQRRCVGVRYFREGSVDIDVVPILVANGVKEHGWIPDPVVGRYRSTSIERQFALLNALDTRRRDVRAGIRLLKLWAKNHELALKSYAVEVLGLYAAWSGATKSPAGIFWWVLDGLAEGLLDECVEIPEYFSAPECDDDIQIFDPADRDNNLTADLSADEGWEIAKLARATLADLRDAERRLSARRRVGAREAVLSAFGLEPDDE